MNYDADARAIMANDNGSYWRGYLGYPAIALLMRIGAVSFDARYAEALKGIAWKDINTTFKNDFENGGVYSWDSQDKGLILADFFREVESILAQIQKLDLSLLGKKLETTDRILRMFLALAEHLNRRFTLLKSRHIRMSGISGSGQ